ncbi:MAG: MBL fold metallo-hydrolase [Ottowia sp.]|nr:MBL fold metallo-hydrolase [Ottowia sp.]
MTATPNAWPDDVVVLDRGWLSSTNIICLGEAPAVIDTSYVKDESDTVAKVRQALGDTPLADIAHTHLHSDHCGGTHALQQQWPQAVTWVPAASFESARHWDQDQLTFRATGQRCRRFRADRAMQPGTTLRLGQRDWQVHTAPGHDALAVFLFDAQDRILIAGDALWERGIGVIFPEIDGSDTFDTFGQTLDAMEALDANWIVPGHGGAIGREGGAMEQAFAQARQRLAYFKQNPASHTLHAAKVLIKYQLMDVERMRRDALLQWATDMLEFQRLHALSKTALTPQAWASEIVAALVARNALREVGELVCDA